MKIEQLIVQYLYSNKKVSLQNIGTFTLLQDIVLPAESDKEAILPDNAIQFEYNTKAGQDDGLIDYIVQQTRKIKPLATSDLESFTILSRQFINIGKPLTIDGLGTLQKNQAGTYDFIQGHTLSPKGEPAAVALKEKENEAIDFSSPPRKQSGNRWILPLLLIFIVLGSLAYFYFRFNENKKNAKEEMVSSTIVDTAAVKKDTSTSAKPNSDSIASTPVIKKDSFNFKIVIKEYPSKLLAERAFTKLSSYGHKLVMYPKDSVAYKIAMPFMTPLSDTLRARDSLKIFFGGKPYIEIN
jgi:hypothetical protein